MTTSHGNLCLHVPASFFAVPQWCTRDQIVGTHGLRIQTSKVVPLTFRVQNTSHLAFSPTPAEYVTSGLALACFTTQYGALVS